MSGDKKCQICQEVESQCTCQTSTVTTKTIQSSIKPPDLFQHKEDLPLYARRLRRWGRSCGVDPKLQVDIILLHPSSTNKILHDRLDRELGDQLQDNANAVETIIKTLEQWFGVDKGVDLMKVFNDLVNK